MPTTFTNQDLADRLNMPLTRVRRYVTNFLPPDPQATLQSGYSRKHDQNQAFIILLGSHLVSKMRFTTPEAFKIMTDIDMWMRRKGIYPIIGPEYQPDGWGKKVESTEYDPDGEPFTAQVTPSIIYPTDIQIFTTNVDGEFYYVAIRTISFKKYNEYGTNILEKQYVEELIVAPPPPGTLFWYDKLNVRILRITELADHLKRQIVDHYGV